MTSGLKFDLPLKELQELAEGTALNISVSLTLGGGTDLVHALNFPVITVKLGSTLNDTTDFKNGNMNGWEIPNRDIYNQNSPVGMQPLSISEGDGYLKTKRRHWGVTKLLWVSTM